MKSLFGEDIPNVPGRKKTGRCEVWKAENHYQKAVQGSNCSNCAHFHRVEYHDKKYLKCTLLGFTHGEATDVRASYVCDRYERR